MAKNTIWTQTHKTLAQQFGTLSVSSALLAILLFGALFDLYPYLFYDFIRWCVFLFGIFCFYQKRKTVGEHLATQNTDNTLVIALVFGVLFNPILPFYLGREAWIWVDVVAGTFFAYASTQFSQERTNFLSEINE